MSASRTSHETGRSATACTLHARAWQRKMAPSASVFPPTSAPCLSDVALWVASDAHGLATSKVAVGIATTPDLGRRSTNTERSVVRRYRTWPTERGGGGPPPDDGGHGVEAAARGKRHGGGHDQFVVPLRWHAQQRVRGLHGLCLPAVLWDEPRACLVEVLS